MDCQRISTRTAQGPETELQGMFHPRRGGSVPTEPSLLGAWCLGCREGLNAIGDTASSQPESCQHHALEASVEAYLMS